MPIRWFWPHTELETLVWLTSIKNTLECKGMLSFDTNSYEGNLFINKIVSQVLSDEFH